MPYLFTLLGITIWVTTVAVSSSALISYENSKQQQTIQANINGISQQTIDVVNSTPPTLQEIVPVEQTPQQIPINTNTKMITPEVVVQPKQVIVTPAKTSDTSIYTTKRTEQEEDEEDN